MIPLLNKLPKTPDRPPIRYNIKTEYITEELNNTFICIMIKNLKRKNDNIQENEIIKLINGVI